MLLRRQGAVVPHRRRSKVVGPILRALEGTVQGVRQRRHARHAALSARYHRGDHVLDRYPEAGRFCGNEIVKASRRGPSSGKGAHLRRRRRTTVLVRFRRGSGD